MTERLYNSSGAVTFPYRFKKFPQAFLTNTAFSELSVYEMFLLMLILDRMELSYLNPGEFSDDNGNAYVYFTISEICEKLRCSHNKAVSVLSNLENNGFIVKLGKKCGKPNRIGVCSCVFEYLKTEGYDSPKRNSDIPQKGTLVFPEKVSNYTEYNNTYINNTNTNTSSLYDKVVEELNEQIESDLIIGDPEIAAELVHIMAEIIVSESPTVRIGKTDYPTDAVISRFRLIRNEHIDSVIYDIEHMPIKIYNIKSFMLNALFNVPVTYQGATAAEYSYNTLNKYKKKRFGN